jgi:hypothetical protein
VVSSYIRELERRGLKVERQRPILFTLDAIRYDHPLRPDMQCHAAHSALH